VKKKKGKGGDDDGDNEKHGGRSKHQAELVDEQSD